MARIIRKADWSRSLDVTDLVHEELPGWLALPSRGVLRPEDMEEFKMAETIIGKAEAEAEQIREGAQDVLAQAHERYQEEKERGYQEGLAQAKAEYLEKLMTLKREREEMFKNAEGDMIQLVSEVIEKVLGEAIEKGSIVAVVKHALSQLQGRQVIVRVNPTDIQHLKVNQPQFVELVGQSRSLSFQEDETVEAGGCIVETEVGTLDAQLSTQLVGIKKAFGLS